MFKRIIQLFGFLIVLLALNLVFSQTVFAKEGDCQLKNCLVPAPTIVMPLAGQRLENTQPAIRGLTWKTTIVKVFLDGQELTNLQQRKHQDYYASFFVVPATPLAVGRHYLYTIAYSEKPGWFDQSIESTYIYFEIVKPAVSQQVIIAKVEDTQKFDQVATAQPEEVNDSQFTNQQLTEPEIDPEAAKGISDLGERLKENFAKKVTPDQPTRRMVITGALVIILLVVLLILICRRCRKNYLPPPPKPPK